LPTALLEQAARHLLAPGRRVMLRPADEGGYWLLGMQSPEPALYARIAFMDGNGADCADQFARLAGTVLDGQQDFTIASRTRGQRAPPRWPGRCVGRCAPRRIVSAVARVATSGSAAK
jgi:Uncharacterized protein conserved in bacteria (DUF2064)